jgi:hypothetical protein
MQFLDHHFDKLLLTTVIIIFVVVWVCSDRGGDFAIRSIDTLTGALVGIITGAKISEMRRQAAAPPPDDTIKSN